MVKWVISSVQRSLVVNYCGVAIGLFGVKRKLLYQMGTGVAHHTHPALQLRSLADV